MASTTTSTNGTTKPRKMPTSVKKELSAKRKSKPARAASATRVPFIAGSLNDQLSKLEIGMSYAKAKRFALTGDFPKVVQEQSQEYFKQQNSILSGGIAKVRGCADHKHKRFKMERGSYTSSSNDAMFFFITVTRME